MKKKKIIIGMTGASGAIYTKKLLEILKENQIESHLVLSKAAIITLKYELNLPPKALIDLADFHYQTHDFSAPIASGSFLTDGMIIAPCSAKSFSELASGVCTSLLTRAADVSLKERRPLVLMVRETPLHQGHLESLAKLASYGANIAPPVPAFYTHPKDLNALVTHSVGRCLDLLGIHIENFKRWGED